MHDMASPPELGLHNRGLNSWQFGTSEDLLVGHPVFPVDGQKSAKAAEVELL